MFSSLTSSKHQEDCRKGFEGNREAFASMVSAAGGRATPNVSEVEPLGETSVPEKFLRQSDNPRGETLAETVIALLILAIGITFSGALMANSLGNITVSKNRVVAVNIAREGLEAMRNLRDTNWLRFSGNRRECWNHFPGSLPDDCEGDSPVEPADYILYKDENQRWRLRLQEVAAPFDNSRLYLIDVDLDQDTDRDGNRGNDDDIYNHRLTADNSALGNGDDPLGYTNSRVTLFKRFITIDYLTNAGDSITEGGIPLDSTHNRMVVSSRVTWPAGNREVEVTLRTHLTDYLGREDLTN